MMQIRLRPPRRREFLRDVYRPGVISLSRLLWGSLGAGLFLCAIALCSSACGVGVLYPPLAATCFINGTCVYLRVARPKQVIVGHFVSTVGGLTAVFLVTRWVTAPALLVPFKLGLAVTLAAVLMQVFDADHPPAAATAAIPAILPLPAEPFVLPLHMAWGGVLAVVFSMLWNRVWFTFPAPETEPGPACMGLALGRAEAAGLGACVLATVLMGLGGLAHWAYQAGLGLMLLGLGVLMFEHFFAAVVILRESPAPAEALSRDREVR